MRSTASVTWLALAFAGALALAQALPAAASPAADDATIAGDTAGALPDHGGRRGPGRPGPRREPDACQTLAHTVKQACPCNGPQGAGYPTGHEGYVECVAQALDAALAGSEDPALAECATKILERATASEIGNPDFECPERKRCDAPAEPTEPAPLGAGTDPDHRRHPKRGCRPAEPTATPEP
jgi:hypothetical protein